MTTLLVLPILIPVMTAACCTLAWRGRRVQRSLGAIGATAHLVVAVMILGLVHARGISAVQIGEWPAPFGITLVADLFSAVMVLMAALVGWTVALYSLFSLDRPRESFGYYPLLHVLLMGVSGAFLTGDIFNLYVWFEVMLMASFVLLTLGGERPQMEGAIKYVTLNLLSSALFLAAVGLLYGMAGTLNMADLSQKLAAVEDPELVTVLAMLFLAAFGIKSGAFPLFFWLPASYHTPPPAVSAVFAGLLTKVGVYALIRVFTLLFVHEPGITHTLILIVSGFTMVTGVLGAVAQNELRRLLSFHIISQIGYMLMGLGLFTPLALAGSMFHILHNMLAKTNLFLVSGVIYRRHGTYELKKLGGLYRNAPGLSALFLISAFALAGFPPLSGFFSKLILVKAGLEIREWAIVATALAVSLLTLFSMTKIWGEAFWKAAPSESAESERDPVATVTGFNARSGSPLLVPIAIFATLIVLTGLAAGPVFNLLEEAAEQLLDPERYVEAVLGKVP